MLTFECGPDGVLEVNFDVEGRDELLAVIRRTKAGDHERMATPSWGGDELTEDFPNPDLIAIHQVTFQCLDSQPTKRHSRTLSESSSRLLERSGEHGDRAHPTLTPRMQRTMSRAGELARAKGHDYLGTEHLILALIEDSDGIAGGVMHKLNCATAVRDEVVRIIESDGYSRRSPGPTDSAPGA